MINHEIIFYDLICVKMKYDLLKLDIVVIKNEFKRISA